MKAEKYIDKTANMCYVERDSNANLLIERGEHAYPNLLTVMRQKNVTIELMVAARKLHRHSAANKPHGRKDFTCEKARVLCADFIQNETPENLAFSGVFLWEDKD